MPKGAHAGHLTLKPCTYATEKGSYAADCGTLVVPENRADPDSRLIALPVTRIQRPVGAPRRSRSSASRAAPASRTWTFTHASRFAEDHDVVLVGYRGVDGSVRLDCPEVDVGARALDRPPRRGVASARTPTRSAPARTGSTDEGVDLAGYGLVQQVDDLEAARVALGYDRIDLLSESAGTRTAMIYAWRYPESIHRSVMIGVNPPGNFLWDREDDRRADRSLRRPLREGRRAAARGPTTSSATIRRTTADMPDRWFFLPIKQGNVRIVSFFGLMESTSEAAPASGPMTLDAWLSAAEGDASGFWFASLAGDAPVPGDVRLGPVRRRRERRRRAAARDYFSSAARRSGSRTSATPAPRSSGAAAGSPTRGRPRRTRTSTAACGRSKVETLLIGGELDFATPPQVATKELLPVPAERPPGRAAGLRPHGSLLERAARGRHAT